MKVGVIITQIFFSIPLVSYHCLKMLHHCIFKMKKQKANCGDKHKET